LSTKINYIFQEPDNFDWVISPNARGSTEFAEYWKTIIRAPNADYHSVKKIPNFSMDDYKNLVRGIKEGCLKARKKVIGSGSLNKVSRNANTIFVIRC